MASEGVQVDLIVVGLGAMGAATAFQARRRGLRVLGLDRHHPPHTLGSTHAETRITRLAVGEGPQYLPFVRRSHEIWRELEEETGRPLLHTSGGLIVTEQAAVEGQRWEDFVVRTSEIAGGAGIDFEVLDPAESGVRFPLLHGLDGKRLGYEPTGGVVMAERALETQLELAAAEGADLRMGETVRAVEPDGDGVDVITDRGRHRADRVVLAAGPWMPDLIDDQDRSHLRVTRQVVFWFEVEDPEPFTVGSFPFVMWIGDRDLDYVGIFPIPPEGTPALKILGEQFATATDPDRVERVVGAEEIEAFHDRHVATKLSGVGRRCVRAEVCLYTNTSDDHFLIDVSPSSDRVLVMSPCSGHGFKHSAALGEAVAEVIATGSSTLDLTPFGRDRW